MKFSDLKSLSDVMTALPDEKSAANLLFNEGLIKNNVNCSKCGNPMQLRSRANGYEWRCRSSKSKDCSSESIRHGSFFARTKLTLLQAIKVIVLWKQKNSAKQISKEVGISEQTVCDWRNFLREICTSIELSYGKLGGIDRTTGRVAKILVPLLQASVDKNSIVYSDERKSYSQLKHYFSEHCTVCHKIQFVNIVGSRRVCTNGVEAMGSRLKAPFKSGKGTRQTLLDSYISEFFVRENEKDDFFSKVLDEMKSKVI
ncbi:Protein CBG26371 [Caenorhabditis briggsae]|uniref:Protein CBG26371 n=1 Tax=Caenorhabditis briggsae TaxID=6238 RepID=B6IG37_CAEBR|nr:Protein CBG26371 [Caenorhabditis briggsae]CAR98867.1 Protein CBG26371 [Caenorhabditis briggsae]